MKRTFIILVIIPIIAACMSKKPSDSAVVEMVEKKLNSERNEAEKIFFEYKNVQKQNGYSDNEMYVAEITYDQLYLIGLLDVRNQLKREAGQDYDARRGVDFAIIKLAKEYGEFKKGDIKKYSGKVKFVNSEKGWIIVSKS